MDRFVAIKGDQPNKIRNKIKENKEKAEKRRNKQHATSMSTHWHSQIPIDANL